MINYCLFVVFFIPLEKFSNLLIWRRHHCRWWAANFDLCSALMAWSSEGSLACHTYYDTGHPLSMVISEDPWHSFLLASVWRSIIDLNVSLHSSTNISGRHMNNFMHFGWVINLLCEIHKMMVTWYCINYLKLNNSIFVFQNQTFKFGKRFRILSNKCYAWFKNINTHTYTSNESCANSLTVIYAMRLSYCNWIYWVGA